MLQGRNSSRIARPGTPRSTYVGASLDPPVVDVRSRQALDASSRQVAVCAFCFPTEVVNKKHNIGYTISTFEDTCLILIL